MKTDFITIVFFTFSLTNALVPKQVVKHGLMTFISEIAEPTESNVCFLFFEKMVEVILDEQKSFEEALASALTQDFTHATVKGRCQKTYKVVMEKFSNHAPTHSKVKNFSAFLASLVTLIIFAGDCRMGWYQSVRQRGLKRGKSLQR